MSKILDLNSILLYNDFGEYRMQEVTIENDNLDEVQTFFNPRYVFIPLKPGFKLRVKDNDYIYKNDIVALNSKGKMLYSSISGRVLGVKELNTVGGVTPTLVIENDFMENVKVRKSARKFLSGITKDEFFSAIEDFGFVFKGVYESDKLNVKTDEIVVNGIDLEPLFKNKYYILKDNVEDILETVDLIGNMLDARKITLAIVNSEPDLINSLVNAIGTYPNIQLKLIDDEYPNGCKDVLFKKLGIDDALEIDACEVYYIREILKRNVPAVEKYISIVGDGVQNGGVIKVKYGTLLSEVFVSNFGFSATNVEVYLNGEMHGERVSSLKYVIDEDLDGLSVKVASERKTQACINCGICSKKCPKGLNPKYVFDHKGNVKDEYTKDCIDCGLCSHLCPSFIDLRKYMRLGRKKL